MKPVTNTYLALGANLGDAKETLRQAVHEIKMKVGSIVSCSSVYLTSPMNSQDNSALQQPDFLNVVLQCRTNLEPPDLLGALLKIEKSLGRNREHEIRWGPRSIDIDIIAYGDCIIKESFLEIPHPHMAARDFVLIPLQEIAPDFKHPCTSLSISKMLASMDKKFIKEKLNVSIL